jgi:TonB family protein
MAGNKISGPVPKYPAEAKKEGIQGTVVLDAVIGKDGTVEELRVASGPKELQQSSLDAVRQWIYKPFLLNGDPVEVKTTINVVYSLAKK